VLRRLVQQQGLNAATLNSRGLLKHGVLPVGMQLDLNVG
jgi:hypothetical protein